MGGAGGRNEARNERPGRWYGPMRAPGRSAPAPPRRLRETRTAHGDPRVCTSMFPGGSAEVGAEDASVPSQRSAAASGTDRVWGARCEPPSAALRPEAVRRGTAGPPSGERALQGCQQGGVKRGWEWAPLKAYGNTEPLNQIRGRRRVLGAGRWVLGSGLVQAAVSKEGRALGMMTGA
ncbi:uncharacterized protein LOC101749837 isoform X1 [Gallus gallus]|uniref:uncharacterized protein LOC101749837 isoform X1 n=1 Tax=Gallus gallus TaxID=9031 RepID=UPI001F01BC48|nr:uncharacterized protein LOC101749837 isoform X1 [Gallus gallus]